MRALCSEGEQTAATTLALQAYGQEIMSFMISRLGSESAADEAFSLFAEDLWAGLSAFRWQSSLRTWAYRLARHAGARHVRQPARRPERNLALSKIDAVSKVIEHVRTQTRQHMRTQVKSRMRELRAQLPQDDQTLLILHVDRELPFREVALILFFDDAQDLEAVGTQELARAEARLRKRYKSARARLRSLAEADGLIPARDN